MAKKLRAINYVNIEPLFQQVPSYNHEKLINVLRGIVYSCVNRDFKIWCFASTLQSENFFVLENFDAQRFKKVSLR